MSPRVAFFLIAVVMAGIAGVAVTAHCYGTATDLALLSLTSAIISNWDRE